jgi:hypothetical protein
MAGAGGAGGAGLNFTPNAGGQGAGHQAVNNSSTFGQPTGASLAGIGRGLTQSTGGAIGSGLSQFDPAAVYHDRVQHDANPRPGSKPQSLDDMLDESRDGLTRYTRYLMSTNKDTEQVGGGSAAKNMKRGLNNNIADQLDGAFWEGGQGSGILVVPDGLNPEFAGRRGNDHAPYLNESFYGPGDLSASYTGDWAPTFDSWVNPADHARFMNASHPTIARDRTTGDNIITNSPIGIDPTNRILFGGYDYPQSSNNLPDPTGAVNPLIGGRNRDPVGGGGGNIGRNNHSRGVTRGNTTVNSRNQPVTGGTHFGNTPNPVAQEFGLWTDDPANAEYAAALENSFQNDGRRKGGAGDAELDKLASWEEGYTSVPDNQSWYAKGGIVRQGYAQGGLVSPQELAAAPAPPAPVGLGSMVEGPPPTNEIPFQRPGPEPYTDQSQFSQSGPASSMFDLGSYAEGGEVIPDEGLTEFQENLVQGAIQALSGAIQDEAAVQEILEELERTFGEGAVAELQAEMQQQQGQGPDGMDDRVRANLTPGELVVSNPQLADYGNGDREAGAKKLQQHLADVSKAHRGTAATPSAVDPASLV